MPKGRERHLMGDEALDFSMEELREFLEADTIGASADPEFKESLRRRLWDIVAGRRPRGIPKSD